MSKSIGLSDKINTLFSGVSKLYKVNPKFSWLLIILSLLGSLQYLQNNNQPSQPVDVAGSAPSEVTAFAIAVVTILFFPLVLVALIIIEGMFAYTTLRASKGKKPTIKEAFQASKSKFWTLLLVGIIVFFKVLGGLILFIIPGIRAICRYIPASLVVFDKNLSASETVNYTKEISKNNLTIEFILILAAAIITPIGYFLQQGGLVGLYPFLKKQAKGRQSLKASELFVASLESCDVKYVFGVPGEENLELLEAIRKSSIEMITTRDEQTAVFMAATVGRLTGRTGVALSTLGPGATNLVTGVAYAQLGAMPLLVITGQKPIKRSKQGKFQIIDVVGMMKPITKLSETIVSADRVPSSVYNAIRIAEQERPGAVHLEFPEDIADEKSDVRPIKWHKTRRPNPDEKSIDKMVEAIESARSPIILIEQEPTAN